MADFALHPEITLIPDVMRLGSGSVAASSKEAEQPPATASIDELLSRIHAGDRHAAAEFLLRFESRIRRRVRGKLLPDVRRLFDSLDILSTLGRRLDDYVLTRGVRAESELEVLSLLFKMADHALIDKTRTFSHLKRTEGEDSEFAHLIASRLRDAARDPTLGLSIEIDACLRALPDPIDRRILSLWLTGRDHKDIATVMRLPSDRIRKRWQSIKAVLRTRFPKAVA